VLARGSFSGCIFFFPPPLFFPFSSLAFFPLCLKRSEVVAEPIEPLFPEPAIFLEPIIGLLECPYVDATGAHLRIARARNEACPLQHFQMLGDCRQTHVERLGEPEYGGFTERKPREDRAPRGVGKSRERRAEAICCHLFSHIVK